MLANHASALARDIPRQGTTREPRSEEIDNVRIAKKIVEKWFYSGGGIRPAQLEEHHADFFLFGHRSNLGHIQNARVKRGLPWSYFPPSFKRRMSSCRLA